jgi:hypothetical protein
LTAKEEERILLRREGVWIRHFNSVINGLNTKIQDIPFITHNRHTQTYYTPKGKFSNKKVSYYDSSNYVLETPFKETKVMCDASTQTD